MEKLNVTKGVSEKAVKIYNAAIELDNLGIHPKHEERGVGTEEFDEAVNLWMKAEDRSNRNPLLWPGYDVMCRPLNFLTYSAIYTTLLTLGISNMTDTDFVPTLSYVGASWITVTILSALEIRRRAQNKILNVISNK